MGTAGRILNFHRTILKLKLIVFCEHFLHGHPK